METKNRPTGQIVRPRHAPEAECCLKCTFCATDGKGTRGSCVADPAIVVVNHGDWCGRFSEIPFFCPKCQDTGIVLDSEDMPECDCPIGKELAAENSEPVRMTVAEYMASPDIYPLAIGGRCIGGTLRAVPPADKIILTDLGEYDE